MKQLPISLIMAWRETRGSWHQFTFFLVCVAIGVGSVVGVELFAINMESIILGNARVLLGGDLEVRLRRTLSESGKNALASLKNRRVEVTHVRELVGMAAIQEDQGHSNSPKILTPLSTQLVELKVVE